MAKKLTINAVAMGNLRHRKKQYAALVVGVVLAMIFSCGVPFFISCNESSRREIHDRQMGRQDMVLLDMTPEKLEPLTEAGVLDGAPGYMHMLSYGWTEKQEKGTPIGWLDGRAQELYNPQVLEGRMPLQTGEIAIERGMLLRMGLEEIKVGETVSLHETACNGTDFLSGQTDKSYTLVGILDNRKLRIEQSVGSTQNINSKLPGAFVSAQELPEPDGRENLLALLKMGTWSEKAHRLISAVSPADQPIRTDGSANPITDPLSYRVMDSMKLVTGLALMLAFLSGFGIANAFSSNLKERRKQIGMLRAVGATRRQIIQLFGREAVLIALVCTPVSVAIAYCGVRLFAKLMGDYFVFLPSFSVLLRGAAFGFVVVILSALIPLLSVSRIPPMQAIRDTELMRKMKHKRVKSRHAFQMDRLLASRRMMFRRGRFVCVSLILAFTTVVMFLSVGIGLSELEEYGAMTNQADYEVSLNGGYFNFNTFESKPELNHTISEAQRQEAMLLPGVHQVTGQKRTTVNLLVDGALDPYLLLNEYYSFGDCGRFLGFGSLSKQDLQQLSRDNLHETMEKIVNPEYEKTRQWAGYEQELFSAGLVARSAAWLERLQSNVLEGSIDIEKLNSGEEIILNAPEKIGFCFEHQLNGGFSYGLMDISEEGLRAMSPLARQNANQAVAEAENPFHVGDTLTLSMLVRGDNGEPIRKDRTVRVGAIISESANPAVFLGSGLEIYTTVEGLDQFGQTFGYDGLNINLANTVTPELDAQMQSALEAIFPGRRVRSLFADNERRMSSFKTEAAMAGALIAVLCTVSVSLVNNSISAQIREGKRTIGTLRAVGASQRDIVRSFVRQIFCMTVLGVVIGTAIYCGGSVFLLKAYGHSLGKFVLWPAPILFAVIFGICWFHLVCQVRKVSSQSIVDNIREL